MVFELHKQEKFTDHVDIDFIHDGMSVQPGFKIFIDNSFKNYKVNTYGYRCDEFTENHEGKHVLFTGCSITFGEGIPDLEDTWAKKIFNVYKAIGKVSGFYNIAVPGTGIQFQVINLFRYFSRYGNPEVLFFNISEYHRGYVIGPETNKIINGFYSDPVTWRIMEKINYEYYFMLEQYCKSNNIKLISWTWDFIRHKNQRADKKTTQEVFTDFNFPTFYKIDPNKFTDKALMYAENNPNKDFLMLGSDGQHLGVAYHHAYAEMILENCPL